MGLFDKFFGVVSPSAGAPILGAFYGIVGIVFTILSFGRWIMPHADIDLSLPWAIVSLLLAFTGFYGLWGSSKGSTWHKRQFVSASWGFLLMFLCWAVVYIAVEDHHAERVNGECVDRNKDNAWTLTECDDRRKKAVVVASVLVSIAMVIGIYFTLVLSKWVTSVEWEEHLERERRLDQWRSGHAEKETDVVA